MGDVNVHGKPVLLVCALLCFVSLVYAQEARSNGFFVFFTPGASLGLNPQTNATVTLTVLTGNISGDASVYMHGLDGRFSYIADNVSTFRVNYDGIKDVLAEGDSGNARRKIDDGTVLTIAKTNSVIILYNIGIYDPFDEFTDLGIGLFGFLCVGIGCFWGAYQVKRDEWIMNRLVGFSFALTFLIVGVGLIIGWLW